MRKLLNNPWFVAVMAVTALALVAHGVFSHGEKLGLAGFDGTVATAEAEVSADDAAQAGSVVRNLQIPGPLRDPFAVRAKVETVEKISEPDFVDTLHLSAIWTQGGQTLVLLNDHICQGGDEIGRVKIESATQEGVWITHWKGRDFLSIGANFTLNTPASKVTRVAAAL
jgi:hypothetical protein